MNVLAITVGDPEAGSTQYRLIQYLPHLEKAGVMVERVHRNDVCRQTVEKAARADVLFNQKSLFSAGLAKQLIKVSRRVIFDFDDAVFTRPGKPNSWLTRRRLLKRLHLWLREADGVVPANQYLADYARKFSRNVEVLPMSLNLRDWYPRRKSPDGPTCGPGDFRSNQEKTWPIENQSISDGCHGCMRDAYGPGSVCVPHTGISTGQHPLAGHSQISEEEIVIGWAGAPVNLSNLERLEPVLETVLARVPSARLAVFSGKRPELNIPFDYHPYRSGAEPDFVSQLDIGLLPLVDEPHARGKSPIKAIQYCACGIPVVGNRIGATAEILSDKNSIGVSSEAEWVAALEALCRNPDKRQRLGQAGVELARRAHDLEKNGQRLLEILTAPDKVTP